MKRGYSVKEAANLLGYSTNTIYTFLKNGELSGVRLGKGRFRIPKSEIDKLLLIEGGKIPQTTPVSVPLQVSPAKQTFRGPASASGLQIPSLFDWFFGMGSIIFGLSLFLFNQYSIQLSETFIAPWISGLRIVFICVGVGIVYIDVLRQRMHSAWHNIFFLTAGMAYLLVSIGFVLRQEYIGLLVVTPLAGIAFIHGIISMRGIALFVMYAGIVAIGLPMAFMATRGTIDVGLPIAFLWLIAAVILLVGFGIFWMIYKQSQKIFWVVIGVMAAEFLAFGIWHGIEQYWVRGYFLLHLSLSCLFVPIWEGFRFSDKRDRVELFVMYAGIFSFFLTTIIVTGVMQRILIDYAKQELESKAIYAAQETSKEVLGGAERIASIVNPSILEEALKEKDGVGLQEVLRSAYKANKTIFRSIAAISLDGKVLGVYPDTTSSSIGQSIAHREYFQTVVRTKKQYITNAFVGLGGSSAVVVSTPILNAKGDLVGIINSGLDLVAFSTHIQQLASPSVGESVSLSDENNYLLAHPDLDRIGSLDEPDASVGFAPETKTTDELADVNFIGTISVRSTVPHLGWSVRVQAPIFGILKPSWTSLVVMFGLSTLAVLFVALYTFVIRARLLGKHPMNGITLSD